MSAREMAAAALMGSGQPIMITGAQTTYTRGLLAQGDVGDEWNRRFSTRVTIPADVPVRERDGAAFAGRDYVVRGIHGGGQFSQTLDLEAV